MCLWTSKKITCETEFTYLLKCRNQHHGQQEGLHLFFNKNLGLGHGQVQMAFTEYIEHAKITLLSFLLQISYKPQAIHTCYSVINCRLYYIISNSSDFCEMLLQKNLELLFSLFSCIICQKISKVRSRTHANVQVIFCRYLYESLGSTRFAGTSYVC